MNKNDDSVDSMIGMMLSIPQDGNRFETINHAIIKMQRGTFYVVLDDSTCRECFNDTSCAADVLLVTSGGELVFVRKNYVSQNFEIV